MIQAISRAERLNMLPEDYCLRKQFLLRDIKEELSLIISLLRNNPYSSDLKEYVKAIQNEINELGYFCILPNPDSINAENVYQRTLIHMQFLTERDCKSLAAERRAAMCRFVRQIVHATAMWAARADDLWGQQGFHAPVCGFHPHARARGGARGQAAPEPHSGGYPARQAR